MGGIKGDDKNGENTTKGRVTLNTRQISGIRGTENESQVNLYKLCFVGYDVGIESIQICVDSYSIHKGWVTVDNKKLKSSGGEMGKRGGKGGIVMTCTI